MSWLSDAGHWFEENVTEPTVEWFTGGRGEEASKSRRAAEMKQRLMDTRGMWENLQWLPPTFSATPVDMSRLAQYASEYNSPEQREARQHYSEYATGLGGLYNPNETSALLSKLVDITPTRRVGQAQQQYLGEYGVEQGNELNRLFSESGLGGAVSNLEAQYRNWINQVPFDFDWTGKEYRDWWEKETLPTSAEQVWNKSSMWGDEYSRAMGLGEQQIADIMAASRLPVTTQPEDVTQQIPEEMLKLFGVAAEQYV